MAFASRFFGMTLLAAFACLSGSPQTPPPAALQPPATAPRNPPPAPAPAPAASDVNPGIAMIQDLLASLGKFEQDGHPAGRKVGFEIPESVLNEYLAYTLRTHPRPGIGSMTVALLPDNQVSSDMEIDFDAVQKWNPGIFPDILRGFLTGKRAIHADVTFEVKNGSCSFDLKNAMGPDGKAIVNKVMYAVLQALGSRQPESYDTAKPIPLPFGLKKVWTGKQLICGET